MFLHSIKNRYCLLRGLVNGRIAHSDPIFIDIDITNRCNLRCIGCIYHSPEITHLDLQNDARHDISLNTVYRLASELDSRRTPLIVLQGAGEPLLHPRIDKIIAVLKEQGFRVTVITNGTLLAPEMNRRLIDSGLDVLKVSVWALTPDQYMKNYPGSNPENYAAIDRALQDLISQKSSRSSRLPRLHLYIPINRYNYDSLDKTVTLAEKWQAENIVFAPMADITDELAESILTEQEEMVVLRKLKEIKKILNSRGISEETDLTLLRYRLKDELWKYIPCTIAWYHARIRTDGSVQSCGRCDAEVIFGNVNKSSFRDIWNGPEIQNFRYQRLWQLRNSYWKEHCACKTCCFVKDMNRINNVFKWIKPVIRPLRGLLS